MLQVDPHQSYLNLKVGLPPVQKAGSFDILQKYFSIMKNWKRLHLSVRITHFIRNMTPLPMETNIKRYLNCIFLLLWNTTHKISHQDLPGSKWVLHAAWRVLAFLLM